MNRRQENKHTTHLKSQLFLKDNGTSMAGLPKFSVIKASIDTSIDATLEIIRRQTLDKSGATETKEDLHDTALESSMELSRDMVAFALVGIKDKTLAKAVKLTSATGKMADTALKEKLEGVVELAEAHQEDAEIYGVTVPLIQKVRTDITNYFAMIPVPEKGRDDVKLLTRELDEQQHVTDELFKEMDALVNLLKDSNPSVRNGYFISRMIADVGMRHLSMKILVKAAVTGEGLKAAEIELVQTEGATKEAGSPELTKSVKKTGAKGGATAKGLNTGKYVIKVTKAGYVTQTLTVYVNEGEMTKVVVELVRV